MKKLKINENWFVDCTDSNNCVLTFTEKRDSKKIKKGIEKEFVEEFFYPTVQTALQAFLLKTQKEATDVQDCIRITKESIQIIKNLKF